VAKLGSRAFNLKKYFKKNRNLKSLKVSTNRALTTILGWRSVVKAT
jgi:hypothetical protein